MHADTTDVQSSTITGSDHQLNVTCFFAEGTQARGCVVRLERSGGVVYQMIPRVNETAKGVVRTEFSVDCYNISVVDWEEDGSVGSLEVPMAVNIRREGCQNGDTGKNTVRCTMHICMHTTSQHTCELMARIHHRHRTMI